MTFKHGVLGTISGAGFMLITFSEIKDYKKKIEMCKFAYTTYEKVLVDLRASLRGVEFSGTQFVFEMKMINLCPLVDKFEKQYDKKAK